MRVCMIAAMARDGAIGVEGQLPWHCPVDLRHFRALTMGRVCLMGRKTADGLKKPLRDRVNLVLTRDRTWSKPGFIPVHNKWDIKRVMREFKQSELWVIGGAEIYKRFAKEAQVIHLTVLDITVPDADAWFPTNILDHMCGFTTQTTTDPNVVFWVFTRDPVPTARYRPPTSMECDF